jgi:hypothetical protein
VPRIANIVEGHGEVEAVPILLRRIAERVSPSVTLQIPRPIRVKRQRVLKVGELERAIELAARQVRAGGCILILLDANGDCPRRMGSELLQRAIEARRDRTIRVVLASREYEAWFLAAARSIAGHHGIDVSAAPPVDPESIRDAKGWLSKQMPAGQGYRETLHQPALTAIFDLDAARAAPSFDKLWRDVTALLETTQGD